MRMARTKEGPRVRGPYEHRDTWRIERFDANGKRRRRSFKTHAKAEAYKKLIESEIAASRHSTTSAAIIYEKYLRDDKGNKPNTIYRTMWSLDKMFPEPLSLSGLSPYGCQRLYDDLRESTKETEAGVKVRKYSVDSHRNILKEAKTFLRWCVSCSFIPENPMEKIEGVGRRKHGKEQLRIKDARTWYSKALELAGEGDDRAVGALMTLLMGLRSSEIVNIRIRDLDDDLLRCDVLHVADSKTEKGKRSLDVPDPLRGILEALSDGRDGGEFLFPSRKGAAHSRHWPRDQVRRICDLCKIQRVTAHGMRGLLATIVMERGAGARLAADTLGHEDTRTTKQSYAKPRAGEAAARAKGVGVLVRKAG